MVLRVKRQDNTGDFLNRLADAVPDEGPGAKDSPRGSVSKMRRIADKYVAKKYQSGRVVVPSQSKRDLKVSAKNSSTTRQIAGSGGSFGESPSEDFVERESVISSGDEVFGVPQTKNQRKVERVKKQKKSISDLRSVINGETE